MKNLSRLMLLLLLAAAGVGLYAQADSLDFPAPQLMLPMYDHYSVNYLNVDAIGRGFTDLTVAGRVEDAVNNPAALGREKAFLYMEVAIKPPINELNQPSDMIYSSPLPLGIFGASGRLYKGLYGAISYNVPKSIVYDDFTVNIGQGADSVVRYPSYYLHEFTATLAGNLGHFSLGLNLHNQLHSFSDIQVFQTFDRVDKTFYVLRIQPGIIYRWNSFNFGAAFTPQTSRKMDIKYAVYDVTLPNKLSAGLSYGFANNLLLAEAEWEQFSSMDSRFKDRLTLKAGIEKRVRKFTYRCGVMSLPGVFSGAYRLPVWVPPSPDDVIAWQHIPRGGQIGRTDQIYATGGFTYNFKGGKLSMGLMRDVLGNVKTTQVSMSMGFNLETLKGRKFLIFDK
jgi:hypothetical protein